MKTLAEGTTKYLLLDSKRIERNAERNKTGDPIVIVLEETGAGIREHRGVNLSVNGAVTLAYAQRGFVAKHNYDRHRAAYMTTAEVVLAETHDEDLPRAAEEAGLDAVGAGGALVLKDGAEVGSNNPEDYEVITDEMADAADAATPDNGALAAKQATPAPTTKKTTRKTSSK